MSMPPLDIHKSNEAKTITTLVSFNKTWMSIDLVTIAGNTSSTSCDQNGNKT